ncbi:DAK2 domain fusion protein YloV [Bacilli bacterium PM5-3]|nr:DAK2 domain fusion protein YloV [Bacilli bacterium PM5-3]MDH6604099.1 DAK2 domain fusion protein YloV [Bacilli bacterium PM5-9]
MKRINGSEFKSMLISGANNLYNYYPEVDTLNVFPVPDGDTGTNMNLTFTSGIKEISNLHSNNIGEVSKAFSRGLLMGARGNSGVILSQIFKGISNDLEGKESVGSIEFAKAFVKGQKIAYKAVMRPVEGTILTVIREGSENTLKVIKHSNTIKEVMKKLVEFSNESLKNTPELLPVLKEVGVVDSGGYGLVKVFEGMLAYLNGEAVERDQETEAKTFVNNAENFVDNHEGQYGYCTEFIVRLSEPDKFKENTLKTFLEKLGDSIVVVSDDDILKVHVHTVEPGKVISKATSLGDMLTSKIENMQEQADNNDNFKPVEQKEQAIIAVSSGEGINNMFYDLRVDHIISGGQTMNPSTKDFIKAIKELNAKKVLILPNNSNIILAAQQAKDVIEDIEVEVIPSKTIVQGMVACINYSPDINFEENVAAMSEALATVKSGEVTYAIKDTKYDGRKIKKNDYMGIFEKDVVANGKDRIAITKELLDKMIDDEELVTIIYGDDVKKEDVIEIEKYVEDNYDLEVELIDGKQSLYSFYIGVE